MFLCIWLEHLLRKTLTTCTTFSMVWVDLYCTNYIFYSTCKLLLHLLHFNKHFYVYDCNICKKKKLLLTYYIFYNTFRLLLHVLHFYSNLFYTYYTLINVSVYIIAKFVQQKPPTTFNSFFMVRIDTYYTTTFSTVRVNSYYTYYTFYSTCKLLKYVLNFLK